MNQPRQQFPQWLNRQEQDALLQVVEKDLRLLYPIFTKRQITRRRNAAIVIFLLHTGLRVSELLNLRLENLKAEEWSVRAGKGRKERTIPLNATARKALAAWLQVRPDNPTDFVFVTVERPHHAPLSLRGVEQFVARYGRLAGLPRLVTPTMLRHTFAKNLADAGAPVESIAALLGRSVKDVRVYVPLAPTDLRQAVEALAKTEDGTRAFKA